MPQVVVNGRTVAVPIVYGNMQRWASVHQYGIYRDNRGQLQYPMIMYKRNSVSRNKQIGIHKIQADNPSIMKTFRIKYNNNNRYVDFNAMPNRQPTSQYVNIVVPDYVTIQYSLII